MRLRLQDKKVILMLFGCLILLAVAIQYWYIIVPVFAALMISTAIGEKRAIERQMPKPVVEENASDVEKRVMEKLHQRVLSYKPLEESGIYISHVYTERDGLSGLEFEMDRLKQNLKSVGNYYDRAYHVCSFPKDGDIDLLLAARRDALYSEWFNDHCDAIFKQVLKKGIEDGKLEITLLSDYMLYALNVAVKKEYVALKMREVELRFHIGAIKEEAKQRAADERKAQKEYERALRDAEKNEQKAREQLNKHKLYSPTPSSVEAFNEWKERCEMLEKKLNDLIALRERAQSMAQQTRAGFVYIISNEESFGKGIFKIGMTRRPDPMIRVNELGDASVPFPFKVHLFIYSEDAPTLETELHRHFAAHRVNTANYMKEFFRVRLSDILKALEEMGIPVERTPELEEDLAAERPKRPPINIGGGVKICG